MDSHSLHLSLLLVLFNSIIYGFQETGPLCACLGGAYRAIHALKAASGGGDGAATGLSFSDAVASADTEDNGENLGNRSWKPQKDASSVSSRQHYVCCNQGVATLYLY